MNLFLFGNFLAVILCATGERRGVVNLDDGIVQRGFLKEKRFLRDSLDEVKKQSDDRIQGMADKFDEFSASLQRQMRTTNIKVDQVDALLTRKIRGKHYVRMETFQGFKTEVIESIEFLTEDFQRQNEELLGRVEGIEREFDKTVQGLQKQMERAISSFRKDINDKLRNVKHTATNKQDLAEILSESIFGEEWIYHDGSCYKPVERSLEFEKAVDECEDMGGFLAEIETSAENKFIAENVLSGRHQWYFIGLKSMALFSWDWAWRWRRDYSTVRYKNWEDGEPNNRGHEHCGEMRGRDGKWNNNRCGSAKPFICEKKTV